MECKYEEVGAAGGGVGAMSTVKPLAERACPAELVLPSTCNGCRLLSIPCYLRSKLSTVLQSKNNEDQSLHSSS